MANRLDVPSLLKAIKREDLLLSGTLSATGTVGGTLARPTARLNAQGANLVAYEEAIGSLVADMNLAEREVQISRLDIDKPQPDGNGRVAATGTYHLDTRRYTADVKSENVRLLGLQLSDGQGVRGTVQLVAQVSGTVDAPEGQAHLVVDSLELNRTTTSQLGRLTIDAVAANKQAAINAVSNRFKLDAEALVALAKPWPTTVKVRADNLDLASLPLEGAPLLDGHLRATVAASGNLTEPERGQATMVPRCCGSWNGQPLRGDEPVPVFSYARRAAHNRNGSRSRANGCGVLTVAGALPLTNRAGQGDLHGRPPRTNLAAGKPTMIPPVTSTSRPTAR